MGRGCGWVVVCFFLLYIFMMVIIRSEVGGFSVVFLIGWFSSLIWFFFIVICVIVWSGGGCRGCYSSGGCFGWGGVGGWRVVVRFLLNDSMMMIVNSEVSRCSVVFLVCWLGCLIVFFIIVIRFIVGCGSSSRRSCRVRSGGSVGNLEGVGGDFGIIWFFCGIII